MNTNAIIFILLLVALSFVVLSLHQTVNFSSVTPSPKIQFDDYVHIVAFSPKTDQILLDEWHHNLVTNKGLGELGNVLNGSHLNLNATWIAIANGTSGTTVILPTDTALSGEWIPSPASATACGLLNATGTSVGQAQGAWNVTKTWTSTCANAIVNATGLYNSSTGGTGSPLYAGLTPLLFAEANFTSTTLQSGDQINVTWGVYITTSG